MSPMVKAAAPTYIPQETRGRWFFWMMVIMTGWLLFAHGCHGDEDNELFTAAVTVIRTP